MKKSDVEKSALPPGERKSHGHREEKAAEKILLEDTQRKRRLLARNYSVHRGELDLVFEEMSERNQILLVFVEVRTRTPSSESQNVCVSGLESITERKRRRVEHAAQLFLMDYRGQAKEVRFDVMEKMGEKWKHWPEAWSPR